jgi:phage baseplate assembly protein W
MAVIKTPFTIATSGKVDVEKLTDKTVIQKIKDYVMTRQFERPMTPLYGANTHYLLFENFDDLVFQEYKTETIRELNKHISGAEIVGMAIKPSKTLSLFGDDESTINIEVQYRLPLGGIRTAEFELVAPLNLTEDSRL